MPISASEIHPEIRFTRLGAVLRHLINHGDKNDTAVGLAHAIVRQPHDRELDHLPVMALSDYMLENPDHELAKKFNWERLPLGLELDRKIANQSRLVNASAEDGDEVFDPRLMHSRIMPNPGHPGYLLASHLRTKVEESFPHASHGEIDKAALRVSEKNRLGSSHMTSSYIDNVHNDWAGETDADYDKGDPHHYSAVPVDRIRLARERHQLAKYAAIPESEVHEDYRPTGIAPRLGHLLNKLASGEVEANGDQRGIATAILKSGDHSMLPILADALDDTGHEHANTFDLRHAPRAIAIDKAIESHVDGVKVRVPREWNRWGIGSISPMRILQDWSGRGPNRRPAISPSSLLDKVRESIPDATYEDMQHSMRRKLHNQNYKNNPEDKQLAGSDISDIVSEDIKSLKSSGLSETNPHAYTDPRREKLRRIVKSLRKYMVERVFDRLKKAKVYAEAKVAQENPEKYAANFSFNWSSVNEYHKEHVKNLLDKALRGDDTAYAKLESLVGPKTPQRQPTSPAEQLADLKSQMFDKLQAANAEYNKLPHEFRNTTDAAKGYTDAKRSDKREEIINRMGIPDIQKKIDELKAKHGIDDTPPIQSPSVPGPIPPAEDDDFELGEPAKPINPQPTAPQQGTPPTPTPKPTGEIASSKVPTPKPAPVARKPYQHKPGSHHPDLGMFGTLLDNVQSAATRAADALSDPTRPVLTKDNIRKLFGAMRAKSSQSVSAGRKAIGDTIRSGVGDVVGGVKQVGKDVADVLGKPAAAVASGLKDLAGFGTPERLTPEERNAGFGDGDPEPPVKVADAVTKSPEAPVVEHFHATYVDPNTGKDTRRIIMTTKGQDHARKWLASQRITPKTLRLAEPHELTIGMDKGTRREKFRRLLKYAMRAPAGGMVVRGTFYKGGSVIPDLEKMTPKSRARLDRIRARWKEKQKAKMECGHPHKMAREVEPHDETYSHAENVIREKVGPTDHTDHTDSIFKVLY